MSRDLPLVFVDLLKVDESFVISPLKIGGAAKCTAEFSTVIPRKFHILEMHYPTYFFRIKLIVNVRAKYGVDLSLQFAASQLKIFQTPNGVTHRQERQQPTMEVFTLHQVLDEKCKEILMRRFQLLNAHDQGLWLCFFHGSPPNLVKHF
jgi:hypothetical protein